MEDVIVRHEPDAGNYYECDTCDEPIDVVYFLCRWDTEKREYYVSQQLCATHKEYV